MVWLSFPEMLDSQLVWARDIQDGYIQGRITEIGASEYDVQPVDSKLPKRSCIPEDIFPSCERPSDNDDNCELMFLNEATLLDNIRNRYYKDKIYVSALMLTSYLQQRLILFFSSRLTSAQTYVANILIAVNPYKEIPDLYSTATLKRYSGKSIGELPPHVYAIGKGVCLSLFTLACPHSRFVCFVSFFFAFAQPTKRFAICAC